MLRFFSSVCSLSISVFIAVGLDFPFSFTEMKANTVYARVQTTILRSSGHSVKDIVKFLKKTERWVNKGSKRKSFEDKSRKGRPSVLTNRTRTVIGKARYKRNNSTR